MQEVMVRGAHGGRINVRSGQILEIINVEGEQICDFFAFAAHDVREFLSPAHCRSELRRMFLKVGDKLVSVLRRPMFEILEDPVGQNDISMPPCDPQRYLITFGIKEHRSCRMNLAEVMSDYNIPYQYLPDSVNFFQNTPILSDGRVGRGRSPSKVGDKIVLRVLMDAIAVASSCPQDQDDVNGAGPSALKLVARDG